LRDHSWSALSIGDGEEAAGVSGRASGETLGRGGGAGATATSTGGRIGVLLGGGGAGEHCVDARDARDARDTRGPTSGATVLPSERIEIGIRERDIPDPVGPKDPLHGITLETIVTELVAYYGWSALGEQIAIRCFTHDPSIASSLKFLRRTPWARAKVESLYLFVQRERARKERT
jgi:hypothetical protein